MKKLGWVALATVCVAGTSHAQPTCEATLQALGQDPNRLQIGFVTTNGLQIPVLPGDTAQQLCDRINTVTTKMAADAKLVQKLTFERDRAIANAKDLQRLVDNQSVLQRNYIMGWALGLGSITFLLGTLFSPVLGKHLNNGRMR